VELLRSEEIGRNMGGFIGNRISSSMSGERTARLRNERLEFANQERERIEGPIKKAITANAKLEQEVRELEFDVSLKDLKYRLTHELSPEFQAELYDGRFQSSGEVSTAIKSTFDSWKATVQDSDAEMTRLFLSANDATMFDVTKVSTWEAGLQYIAKRCNDLKTQFFPPPEQTPAPAELPARDKYLNDVLADLNRQLAECPVNNTRLRDELTRKIYHAEYRQELFGDEGWVETMQEIAEDANKTIPESTSVAYKKWLFGSPQAAEFRKHLSKTEYRNTIRQSFAVFCNDDSFFDAQDKEIAQVNKSWAAASSEDLKRAFGYSKTKRVFEG